MFIGKNEGSKIGADESFWNDNQEVTRASQWTNNGVIGEAIYRRMSGGASSKHWLKWLLEDYFADKHFKRLLSPGCGTGMHEIMVDQSGIVDEIDAFDFAEAALNLARDKATGAKGKINFYKDDINTFSLPDNKYDIVLCSGSLHHVKELEYFLSAIRNAMMSDGYLIVNEYVGDCYTLYNKRQVELINRLYRHFHGSLKSGNAEVYAKSTIQAVLETDPSEAVRSKLILPFLEEYFNVEVYHPFGGFILHPLYPLLNDAEFSSGDTKCETILRLLLEFEDILMESRVFDTDFALCICRQK